MCGRGAIGYDSYALKAGGVDGEGGSEEGGAYGKSLDCHSIFL